MSRSRKLDMAEFERELAALTETIEQYLMYNRHATVMEVMGEFDITYEEFVAASTFHQRKSDALHRYIAVKRAQQGEKGPR